MTAHRPQPTVHRPPLAGASAFQPTWGRGLFAAVLAVGGFLLPQEVPLEWYPLNEPGTDINYLEISCAANVTGEVQIWYDLARHGHQPIDSIRIPISPTTQTYTYTFPMPDAPIVEMRVLPPAKGGELNIRQMRIINRRGEEIRRFTRDLFRPLNEIAAIAPTPEGWKLVSTPTATNPSTRIELFSSITPVGMDHRNLLRCLLSTGYLAMMLLILLLAVLFTFYRPTGLTRSTQRAPSGEGEALGDLGVESSDRKSGWRDLLLHMGFMAGIAVMFAFVGNRGLIRNSVHYARYVPLPVASGLKLELDLLSSKPSTAQLFWDTGAGVNEAESVRQDFEPHQGLQTLRFTLPAKTIKGLRFDPRDGEGRLEVRGIRVVDEGQRTRAVLPLNALQSVRQIAKLEAGAENLIIEIPAGGNDPITEFSPAAVALVNQTVTGRR